jgi:hypothetical protein
MFWTIWVGQHLLANSLSSANLIIADTGETTSTELIPGTTIGAQ